MAAAPAAGLTGPAMLLDGTLNKSFGFTEAERAELKIVGHVAPGAPRSLDDQVGLVMEGLSRIEDCESHAQACGVIASGLLRARAIQRDRCRQWPEAAHCMR